MKKFLTVLCVCTLAICSVFAYQNSFRLSSDEVQTFLELRKASGTMTPDPTYPISGSQLLNLVKSIDSSRLNGVYKTMYVDLVEKLENPQVLLGKKDTGIDIDFSLLGAEVFMAENTKAGDHFEDTNREIFGVLPYKDRIPMIDLKATVHMSEYFTGLIDIDIRRAYYKYNEKAFNLTTLANIGSMSVGFPTQAYASVGSGRFNFTIGRDRIGSGNGKTGNLQFGENILFTDYAKFSFVGDNISYDFTINSFDDRDNSDIDINGDTKNLYVHRFSYAFGNVINATLYEGMIVNKSYAFSTTDSDRVIDGRLTNNLAVLNPFMIFHDTGTFYNASSNNFAGVEILANLPARFQINGQFFIDQIKKASEDNLENGEAAFSALLNVSTTQPFINGTIDVYGEAVYGNPYVYLKNCHGYGMNESENKYKESDIGYMSYLYDYVADQNLQYNGGSDTVDRQYIGYKYGGDLFVVGLGAKYNQKNLKVEASLQYIAKGDFGIGANEKREAQGRADYDFDYAKDAYRDGKNEVQKTIRAFLGADCTVLKGIELTGKLCGLFNFNYLHTNYFKPEFQFSFGVKITPMNFFNINKVSL